MGPQHDYEKRHHQGWSTVPDRYSKENPRRRRNQGRRLHRGGGQARRDPIATQGLDRSRLEAGLAEAIDDLEAGRFYGPYEDALKGLDEAVKRERERGLGSSGIPRGPRVKKLKSR